MSILNFFEQLASTDIKTEDQQTRRESILALTNFSKKFAMATIPGALLASLPGIANAQSGNAIADILNFALTLEYLENNFYSQGLSSGVILAADLPIFQQISKHESEHVIYLQTAISGLGVTPVSTPNFDFTANGAFAPFTNYNDFLALSQAFEDTGVRAYKGQAAGLQSSPATLQVALQIHSVEARHACEVRRLRASKGLDSNLKGWITGSSRGTLPSATQPVYDGEQNVTQGAVTDVSSLSSYGTNAATEAFDEPLTKAQVNAIASLFIH